MLYPELVQSNWTEILERALSMVTATDPRLKDFTEDSPTMALMEGVTYITEDFSYRLNQLPKVIIGEWLRFWGGSGTVALPSSGTVSVVLASPLADALVIPVGTRFYNPIVDTIGGVSLGSGNNPVGMSFVSIGIGVIPAFSTTVTVPVIAEQVGSITNLPINAVSRIDNLSPIASLVSSVSSSVMAGGRDMDDSDTNIIRTLADVTSARTLISANDFRGAIRSLIPGSRVVVVPNMLADGETVNQPGNVHCFVLVPGYRGVNSLESSQLVNILSERLPIGFQLHVSGMEIIDLYIQVNLRLARSANPDQTYDAILNNLRGYVNPYNSEQSSVLYKELEFLVRDANGVDSVGGAYVSILGGDVNNTQAINLMVEHPRQCYNLASLQVNMVTPFGERITYGGSFIENEIPDTQEFEILENLAEEFGDA
jgi:hypothetical protein